LSKAFLINQISCSYTTLTRLLKFSKSYTIPHIRTKGYLLRIKPPIGWLFYFNRKTTNSTKCTKADVDATMTI
jgi:hypothetical protein